MKYDIEKGKRRAARIANRITTEELIEAAKDYISLGWRIVASDGWHVGNKEWYERQPTLKELAACLETKEFPDISIVFHKSALIGLCSHNSREEEFFNRVLNINISGYKPSDLTQTVAWQSSEGMVRLLYPSRFIGEYIVLGGRFFMPNTNSVTPLPPSGGSYWLPGKAPDETKVLSLNIPACRK